MKKLTTSILLTLFSATIFTPTHVDASWLSKTWKKIEKSWNEAGQRNRPIESQSEENEADIERNGKISSNNIQLPHRSDYPTSFRNGQRVGEGLDIRDLTIAGVPVDAKYNEIRKVLGIPSEEKMYNQTMNSAPKAFMRYGGITYTSIFGEFDKAGLITIVNRDAATYRGIAVGDSLYDVYKVYGKPTYINSENEWFYGTFVWSSDAIRGIYFENNGRIITKIRIVNN